MSSSSSNNDDGLGLMPCPFCEPPDQTTPPVIIDCHSNVISPNKEENYNEPVNVQCTYCLSQGPQAEDSREAAAYWNERINANKASSVKDLLRSRHTTRLKWCEPWDSIDESGNKINADITLSATVDNCINIQRFNWCREGLDYRAMDEALLCEFIEINFACYA